MASVPTSGALPAGVPGFTLVKSMGGIDEYRLDSNGLTVLLKPDHSVPVIAFNVTYRVGSRNEVTGTTGATHMLEHLMFKGSTNFNRDKGNKIDRLLEPIGARNNATTSVDRTNYFEIFGSGHLPIIVELEADRMRNLLLRDSDRQAEMAVVRNEYERGENEPIVTLDKEVRSAAYQALPYHHSTIGWLSDIERVPIEKLREFYDTFYWPDNATVTLVGDFEPRQALGLVQKFYGVHPRAPRAIPQIYTQEPEQTGPRRVTVKRPGELGVVIIAHKVPEGRNPDTAAVDVLNAVMSRGQNSRLHRALVDGGLATEAEAANYGRHDPGLTEISIMLAPGITHQAAETAALQEVERIKREGVTPKEVETAIRQVRSDFIYRRNDVIGIALELNSWIAMGDWTLYDAYPQRLTAVTPADVQRVAKTYLNENQSTTGWFVPVSAK